MSLVDQDIIQRFDPSTGPDNATFWSGAVFKNGEIVPDATMNGAAKLTKDSYGTTLEQALEKQGTLDEMPDDWFDPATNATWRAVSQSIAESAEGHIRAFLGDVRPSSVWNQVEFPALIRNDKVLSITIIDAASGEVMCVYRVIITQIS